MRKIGIMILVASHLSGVFCPAAQGKSLTGEDWFNMSREDRRIYMHTVVEKYRHAYVTLRQSHDAYAFMVDYFLEDYPNRIQENIDALFLEMIHERQPSTHRSLLMMRETRI